MNERCMTQTELAERWRISEATLERARKALDQIAAVAFD